MWLKNTFKLKTSAYNNVQKKLLYWWIRIYFITIVGIIILNFTIYLSIMYTCKNCINFSIIQQIFIFILTASYIFLHLLTTPYNLYTSPTAPYNFLQLLIFSYNLQLLLIAK